MFAHTCSDNFDINEETPSGAGTTHSTHGIIIQELIPGTVPDSKVPQGVRSKQHSFHFAPPVLSTAIVKKKVEPLLSLREIPSTSDTIPCVTKCSLTYLTWMVCRGLLNANCTMPEWIGWISTTTAADGVLMKSNIGYLTPILHPITDISTVQHCLCLSLDISKTLGQDFTCITFDLAAAKLAYSLKWSYPDKYSAVFIHLGAFHVMCCYMAALGTMMTGSGFEDILIDSGICASGSIVQVISGKH